MSKDPRLSVRISDDLKKRLDAAEKTTGVEQATIIRRCIEAFCDHAEMHGRVCFPIRIGSDTPPKKPDTGGNHRDETSLIEDRPKKSKP